MARELGVVLPVSFFERAGKAYFNSMAIVDADGSVLGLYRKAHIPNGAGYQEKTYFSPGRHRLSGLEHALWPASAWASAGTSGFRSARA